MVREVPKPTLLILSLSHIAADARVLKQVHSLSVDYNVTTCGFGSAPDEVSDHIELARAEAKPTVLGRAFLIRAHLYTAAYWSTPAIRSARSQLRGRTFDAVLTNDLDTAGLALAVAPAECIHLDLHEYWPGLHDNNDAWVRIRQPYIRWQLTQFATQIASTTVVSDTIAQRYLTEFGIDSRVVANASAYQPLQPQPTGEPLKLVHSGGSQPSRRIENMMQAVGHSATATLDLYLVGGGTEYYKGLVDLADKLGPRVKILPPVSPQALPETLNQYDVGVHVLPPTNSNNALALPNKFFDYVQARLALVIGPTASMHDLLQTHELGEVTESFEVEALTRVIDGLTTEKVDRYKQHSHQSAEELSAGPQNAVWLQMLEEIMQQRGRK